MSEVIEGQPYYRIAETPEEFAQDLLVFGTAAIEIIKEDGDFIDPIYGKCNIKKTLRDRDIRSDYEAYDFMHKSDGTFNKCKRSL